MTPIESDHLLMVKRLVKEPGMIDVDNTKIDLNHMALGIAGEAGEIVDCIKKHTIYGQELNIDNLIEELGDMEFYLAHLRSIIQVNRSDILLGNIDKLNKRYGKTYSDQAAKDRIDKAEENINLQNNAEYEQQKQAEAEWSQMNRESENSVTENKNENRRLVYCKVCNKTHSVTSVELECAPGAWREDLV